MIQSKEETEKILDNFVWNEMKKTFAGSGDDMFYAEQIRTYVNEQRSFWIHAIETFIEMGREEQK
jgi:hypothetical protein